MNDPVLARVAAISAEYDRHPASVAEARQILHLPPA
mgnify:CR=1 FL=1